MANVTTTKELAYWSTPEIKNQILELVKGHNLEPLKTKVEFYKNELAPYFAELSRRNPFGKVAEQLPIITGVWVPIWSTIPFQDILPGRIREQSYQIFHDNGYYANIGRYAPGHTLSFWHNISSRLLAYDLMVIQKYEVKNGQWYIQNIGIEQAFTSRENPLSIDKAEDWFTAVVKSNPKVYSQTTDYPKAPLIENLDKSTVKRFKKIFLATPQFEHLYIDRDFRLVKTRREAKQRPSYTIAVRI